MQQGAPHLFLRLSSQEFVSFVYLNVQLSHTFFLCSRYKICIGNNSLLQERLALVVQKLDSTIHRINHYLPGPGFLACEQAFGQAGN